MKETFAASAESSLYAAAAGATPPKCYRACGYINCAGETSSAPTPEPSTIGLSLLALGSAGIVAWRLRTDKVTRNQ